MTCKIEGNKFVFTFDVNQICIHFGNYDEEVISFSNNEYLLKFKQKFSDNEKCSIKFWEETGQLTIFNNENIVIFECYDKEYTTTSLKCKYDLCKDAVLECIDYHLSYYK